MISEYQNQLYSYIDEYIVTINDPTTQQKMKEIRISIERYCRAIKRNNDSNACHLMAETLMKLCETSRNNKFHNMALELINVAVTESSSDFKYLICRTEILVALGKYYEAKIDYDHVKNNLCHLEEGLLQIYLLTKIEKLSDIIAKATNTQHKNVEVKSVLIEDRDIDRAETSKIAQCDMQQQILQLEERIKKLEQNSFIEKKQKPQQTQTEDDVNGFVNRTVKLLEEYHKTNSISVNCKSLLNNIKLCCMNIIDESNDACSYGVIGKDFDKLANITSNVIFHRMAVEAFDEAIKIEPDESTYLVNRASSFRYLLIADVKAVEKCTPHHDKLTNMYVRNELDKLKKSFD